MSAMHRFSCLLAVCLIARTLAAQVIEDRVYRSGILTPLAYPVGNPTGYPMLAMESGQRAEIHFDEMGDEWEVYQFAAIHCDHEWLPSDLESTEYLEGFPWQEITEVEPSFSTLVDYYHYRLEFPNDMMRPRLSGNYAIVVFTGTDPSDRDSWILSMRVVVYESKVRFRANVHASSVVHQRYTHHEVDCEVLFDSYPVLDPARDLHLSILQNGSWEHSVNGLSPIFIRQNECTFDYDNGKNSFAAGAEWRDFEIKNLQFVSLEVAAIERREDGWNAFLRPDPLMGSRSYESRMDLNGKVFIRNDQGGDDHTDAEYVWVEFRLASPPVSEAVVRVETALSRFDPSPWECRYDAAAGAYVLRILMKQGYYNYRYLVEDAYHPHGETALAEGDHASTENDYHILVYHFDRNVGADRLVGIQPLNSHR